ncbi:glycosyltransferase family 2 protein [Bordetella genomosp. 13]|uniref:glycosyltransferase family 2 protein n=1 Tax=Bordetella genomosp. 13 TaxID=463040 RepID=UPI00164236F7|nr:glycosyltransferase family 2 protein [Bordetella genomosp. 13]
MPDSAPAVSVIMPTHDARRYIAAAIDSVIAQTQADWELIVVDDASGDGTADLVQAYAARDARIRYVRNPRNLGVAATRNRALDLARGRYVAFLDSDDLWMPGKLRAQVAFLDQTRGAVSYGHYRRIDETGQAMGDVRPPAHIDYRAMLRSNFIGNLTGIFRRSELGDLRFVTAGHEDYLFWLDAMRRARTAAATPFDGPLASYRVLRGSRSANKLRAMAWQWRIYRDHLRLSVLHSAWLFLHYVFLALKKRSG